MKKLSSLFIALTTLALNPVAALAQGLQNATQNLNPEGGITNPAVGNLGNNVAAAQNGSLFLSYFITLWRAVITVGALTVIMYFLWGAYQWITAGGDASKVQKARDRITQAMIGMIVLVGSFVIIGFVSMIFFGESFDLLRFTIPSPLDNAPTGP